MIDQVNTRNLFMSCPRQIMSINVNLSLDGYVSLNNSYEDFHAAGVNYLCLLRTPVMTLKIYELPITTGHIVSPHNHAYEFDTFLIDGSVDNLYFRNSKHGERYYRRCYISQLNQ
jgi:hypothetical protein